MAGDGRIGTLLAGYRIESLIGRGGMSVVYLAHHEGLERKAALKLLAPELAENEAFRQRFVRESRIAAGLDHPNVIPVYDAGEADGLLFIAMRYVRGSDLRSLLAEHGPLDAADVVRVMDQLGAALDAAHTEGLVHRDVKPANILLSPATPPAKVGHLYLADFGLTKKSLSGTGITRSGQFVGTIDFVAPEQIRSDPVDGRTDVYSMGGVLYECLTGEPPFVRDTEVAVMFAHLNDPPPAPSAMRDGLPPAVDAVVAKAMAKDPGGRYSSAGELAAAAHDAMRPVLADDASTTTSAPAPVQATRGRRTLIGGGVVAALVAVAVVVAVVAGSGGGGEPQHSPSAAGPTGTTPSATATPTAGTGLPAGFLGVARIDPGTGEVASGLPLSIPSMPAPRGAIVSRPLLAGEGSVWVDAGGLGETRIEKVDPESGEVDDLLLRTSPSHSLSFAEGHSSLWALTNGELLGTTPDELFRVDPGSNDIVADIKIGPETLWGTGLAIGDEGIWVLRSDGVLLEIDPGDNSISHTIEGLPAADGIAVGGGAVWVLDVLRGAVYRVDPVAEEWKTLEMPGGADGVAADAQGVWVMDRASGQVVRLDLATGTPGQQIRVGQSPTSITAGGGFVWVTSPSEGAVWRIDEHSNESDSFPVVADPGPAYVSIGEGGVWVTVG